MAMLREVKHSVFFLIISIALAVIECQYERSEAVITKIEQIGHRWTWRYIHEVLLLLLSSLSLLLLLLLLLLNSKCTVLRINIFEISQKIYQLIFQLSHQARNPLQNTY